MPTPMLFLRRLLSNDSGGCPDDRAILCTSSSMPPISVQIFPSHKAQHLAVLALAVSAALTAVFLLLTYYLLFLRIRSHLGRLRPTPGPAPISTPDPAESIPDDEPDEGGVHHVWYIRTVGLDEPTIASIAIAVYKAGDGLVDFSDCSVCLGEFQEGELLRLLPNCSHAFHLPCIDTWLRAHVNCPLCRAPIVPPPAAPSPEAAEEEEEVVRGGSSLAPEDPPVLFQIGENPTGSLVDLGSSSSSSSSSSSNSGNQPPGDPPEDQWVTIDLHDEVGLPQHVRRSVSMDASAMGALMSMDAETAIQLGAKGADGTRMTSAERCQSTNGMKFFLPRFARGRSASILPL